MKNFAVLVVGRGKLAAELLQELSGPVISSVTRWDERSLEKKGMYMVVHAGSGREMSDVIEFCSETGSALIELSTGDSLFPADTSFPVVICPNVNMQMLYFMAMIKQASTYFHGQDISIAESHQASKKTRPGTAVFIADALGIRESNIRSVRDPKIQTDVIGIPSSSLERHAYHEIVIKDREVEIRLETKVLGKAAYASGLAKVIEMIAERELTHGIHDVVDLVIADK